MNNTDIITKLRIAMTDARQNESHFESWMILNEAICDAIDALAEQPAQQEPVAWRIRCTDPARDWTLMYRHPTTEKQFINMEIQPLYITPPQRTWVGLNHFERTLLRTTYAPLKRLHHIKETNTDIIAEIVNDWDAFFTAIEAKLKENT